MEIPESKYAVSKSKRVSITAIMTALAIVGNYSLVTIPNVELGSIVLFVTAYVFGMQMAVTSTLIMSVIYGSINPWGAFIPEIWLAQVIGWLFVVAAGALLGQSDPTDLHYRPSGKVIGGVGAFVTLFFDLVTTIAYSWVFGVPFVIALITGAFFIGVHVGSNAILFGLAIPSLVPALREQLANQIWDIEPASETEE